MIVRFRSISKNSIKTKTNEILIQNRLPNAENLKPFGQSSACIITDEFKSKDHPVALKYKLNKMVGKQEKSVRALSGTLHLTL